MSSGFDPSYHQRHTRRNFYKLQAITQNVPSVQSLLDLGCNAGYLSKGLLSAGAVQKVVGVDLKADVILPELMNDNRFSFWAGNVVDFPFDHQFDGILYLAVHHHVFARAERIAALQLWERIIAHANRYVVFETGEIAEKGGYYWADSLQRYYASDRDHFYHLLSLVGPRLIGTKVIHRPPIHGVKRHMLRIDLAPVDSLSEQQRAPAIFGSRYNTRDRWQVLESFVRTVGSCDQRLFDKKNAAGTDHYDGTAFFKLRDVASGGVYFGKKIMDSEVKAIREFLVGEAIDHPRIVKPIEVHEKYGLIFPYLPWLRFSDINWSQITNRKSFAKEINLFFKEAKRIRVDLGKYSLQKTKTRPASLLELVDFHTNNLLINVQNRKVVDWKFVDMEVFLWNALERNRYYRIHVLRSLGERVLWSRILDRILRPFAGLRGSEGYFGRRWLV